MARTKNCVDCGGGIPSRLMLDGKSHILTSRKRCLTCQPFKQRLGVHPAAVRKLSKTMKNYLSWPEEWKEEHRVRVLKKGLERKTKLVALGGGSCLVCGCSQCLRAMSFHHRVRADKSFSLDSANIRSRPWAILVAEQQKCDLLCVRCHAEVEDRYTETRQKERE